MLISIENVSKTIKKESILNNINIQIASGSCCGFTGGKL